MCVRARTRVRVQVCENVTGRLWLAGWLGRLEVHTVVVGTVVWRQRKAQGKACEEDRESRAG